MPQVSQSGLQDTHAARAGDLSGIRTVPSTPLDPLKQLAFTAHQAKEGKGLFYEGRLEQRGLGPQPVIIKDGEALSGAVTLLNFKDGPK